ncbi:MAG: virulence RhuM family protein [Chlamydiales bacterium]
MPTPYLSSTEERALEEYKKKLEETDGAVRFERIQPPGPDALFHAGNGSRIWVEVSSVFANDEDAEFLNKNGLRDFKGEPRASRSVVLGAFSEHLARILKTIEERIQAKDTKTSYQSYLEKFGKGVLILYIDNPLFSDTELGKIFEAKVFSRKKLKYFQAIYLYVPSTDRVGANGITQIGGFYSLLERAHLFPPKGEILLFQTEAGQTQIEVLMHGETVWLALNEIAQLFQIHKSGVSRHLKNIFETSELQRDATVANFATVQEEGGRKIIRDLEYYNLEAIIAVAYRVNSHRGTQFRIWATEKLKEFIVKGFVLDDKRLKQAGKEQYFEELLARIRDIRSSERVFWRKVLDIYATSIDYDHESELSQELFKVVQNKMHWAAHGHTAAEIIYGRVNSDKPHMGMTSWTGNIPRKADVRTAKNYLNEDELNVLNRIVTAYLEFAELQALNRTPMYMRDWIAKLDDFLKLTGRDILSHAGTVSHEMAMEKAYAEHAKYNKELLNAPSPVEEHFLEAIRQIEKKGVLDR